MLTYLDRFADLRAAVIGDVMLDCYITGDVKRISPEAPVPVLHVREQRSVPGGAANVAANIASLGLSVDLIGIVGEDDAARELQGALAAHPSIGANGLVAASDRPTIKKLRLLGANQQLVRIDTEELLALTAELEARCLSAAEDAIGRADIVILSDYAKGCLSDTVLRGVIGRAKRLGKPVIVDPKRRDIGGYAGADILTPNRAELSAATGVPCESDEEAERAARAAQAMTGAAILLTRSEKGMAYFPVDGEPIYLATAAQDVFDVSGAGDTVIATFAAALAAGTPVHDSLRMANHAAGIVVSKLGTASVMRQELAASLAAEHMSPSINDGRMLDWEEAATLRWAWHRDKLTVGFANGCFDLLHPGHVSLLAQAAESCDRLIVALNTDASVQRLKGPTRPVQSERARAVVMGAIKGVAAVVLFDQDTPYELIDLLRPDVLIKGEDYRVDQVVGADIVHAHGGRVLLAHLADGQSTSRLIERAQSGDQASNRLVAAE